MRLKTISAVTAFGLAVLGTGLGWGQGPERWTAEKANAWYAEQPWLVGANFVPSDAINQLEMFQAATWNPQLNDKELGLRRA